MSFNYKQWRYNYHNKKVVDLKKFFSEEELFLLEKLGVKIEDEIYTEYEFDCVYDDAFEYYTDEDLEKEPDYQKPKDLPKEVTHEKYMKLLDIFHNIACEYGF